MDVDSGRSSGFVSRSIPEAYETYLAPQLFAPWADKLLERASLPRGATVLDVASGTGVVARAASEWIGETGRVTACDISESMLARVGPGVVPLEGAAERLPLPAASQDVVLCQQGLQFFRDRSAALAEMYRVLRPNGTLGVAVWAAEQPLGLFGPMTQALQAAIPPPIPGAFDLSSYAMAAEDLSAALDRAGFEGIEVETLQLTAVWASMEDALATIYGSLFGPPFAALPPTDQEQVQRAFGNGLAPDWHGGSVSVDTYAHIARARK